MTLYRKNQLSPERRREDILARAEFLRSVPMGAVEALKFVNQPDISLDEVVPVIERDPSWTANLLRLANSAYFGCKRSVSTVRDAFVRLGHRTVFHLVVGSALLPVLRGVRTRGTHGVTLGQHSVAVALAAKQAAKELNLDASDYIFTCGILHDIGRVIFLQLDRKEYMQMLTSLKPGESITKLERKNLGIDHAELGAFILNHWDLPPAVIETVRLHHSPDELGESTIDSSLIFTANHFAEEVEYTPVEDRTHTSLPSSVRNQLGINEMIAHKLMDTIQDSYQNGSPFDTLA